MRSFLIVAIVIHGQFLQPPLDGVSDGCRGVGVVGIGVEPRAGGGHAADPGDRCDTPAAPFGPVAPPPTRACGSTAWIPLVRGVEQVPDVDAAFVGLSQRRLFGSFQITQY